MKHFIEVQKHLNGRTITQRYPARVVGTAITGVLGEVDLTCKCGFVVCECHTLVPPKVTPPVDVLPEGWERLYGDIVHTSGAKIRWIKSDHWAWWPPRDAPGYDNFCSDQKPTRDLAMAAALASVQHAPAALLRVCTRCGREVTTDICSDCARVIAQPVLRPGWVQEGEKRVQRYRHAGLDAIAQLTLAGTWMALGGVRCVTGHPTLEAAQLRAEELAEQERSR